MKIEIKCTNCNNSFITDYKQRNRKFCGRDCFFDHSKKNNTIGKKKDDSVREYRSCLECGKNFEERKKYKRNLCSNECRLLWNSREENKNNRIEKSKKSFFEKNGVESIFMLEDFKKNLKEKFKSKYGVSHPMELPEFVNKLKNTIRGGHIIKLIQKLKDNNLTLKDEYINNKDGSTSRHYTFECDKCSNIFTSSVLGSGKIPICRKCFPIIKNSSLEFKIKDFLNLNNIEFINNERKTLGGREIDIFLPKYNVGFEVNGNYFHSEINGDKDKDYHIDKTLDSQNKKIKLVHIFEDEIILKSDIVISRISNLIGLNKVIYARKCRILEITKKVSKDFLEKNHIQGNSVDNYRYGLFFNEQLVSVMTFGKKRKSLGVKNSEYGEYELIRFANLLNTNVVGGFSKLLSKFIKDKKPKKIETFADIRWSGSDPEKTVYSKNGFKFVKITPPNYWYVKMDKYINRHHRFSFRKDVLVKQGFSKDMTEWEIMKLKGYDRIWDCGSLKFELNLI
jgi:hypothetical protein